MGRTDRSDTPPRPDPARSEPAPTMTAIVQTGYGSPDRVLETRTVPRPTPNGDEVLVRVRATSVNTPDWIVVTGTPSIIRFKSGLAGPKTPIRGTDLAGVVVAVGADVTDLDVGDEVLGAAPGTFAEYTVAPASQLVRKPMALSFEEAAASVMSGLTALIAMRDTGRVGPGTSVLVNGASGGVGTFAVQIAAALGADVTGVCSTRNVDLVRSLGADHVIDYTTEDFTWGDRRYDVILDNVLSHRPSRTARVLAPGGVLIPNSVGNGGGLFAGLPRMAGAAIMGLGSRNVEFARCVFTRDNLAEIASMIEAGNVRVVLDTTYPLDEAASAVAHMLGHHARGNIPIAV